MKRDSIIPNEESEMKNLTLGELRAFIMDPSFDEAQVKVVTRDGLRNVEGCQLTGSTLVFNLENLNDPCNFPDPNEVTADETV